MELAGTQYARLPDLVERLPEFERGVSLTLTRAFHEASEELYLVGGVVRDLLLERGRADLDFATSALPDATRKLGKQAGAISIYDVGAAFGTIGLVFQDPAGDELTVEITTHRSEDYPTRDRRPAVVHGVSLEDDLSRRDFTINAIALNAQTAEVIDPFGGIADLHRKRIRAVGNPVDRFDEDPLRILRAARFAAELDFDIAADTLEAMQQTGPELSRISVERVTAELNRLLVAPAVERGLRALDAANLFPHILPELVPMITDDRDGGAARHKDIWDHTITVVAQSPPRLGVRWAALLHDAAKPWTRSVDENGAVHFFGHELAGAALARKLLKRLKQEKDLQERVARMVAMHLRPSSYDPDWTDSAVRRLALEAGRTFEDLVDLAAADVTSARESRQRAAARRIEGLREHFARLEAQRTLEQLQSPLDGNELMAMFDRPPGRWIGEIKERLREMVIDGDLDPDDKEAAATLARDWLGSEDVG
ncbi:CCA tRNA nucleotidyltransferase [soil metagenome]